MRLTILTVLAALVTGAVVAPDAAAAPHLGPGCRAFHWHVAWPHAPWEHRRPVFHGVTVVCPNGDGLPF